MKAIILDDEPMPAKQLDQLIKKYCFEIKETKLFNVASKAIEHLKDNAYDILFLDVEMPEMDGFQFLEKAEIPLHTKVIFTTAYSEYAIDAFKANALHYLLKPIVKEDLISAVRKASDSIMTATEKAPETKGLIAIYDGENYLLIKVEEIIRFEADGSYTVVFLKDGRKLLSSKRLGRYEAQLDRENFVRCHNSHLVNINYIEKINKGRTGFLTLKNQEIIPVSVSKKDEVGRFLN